MQSSLKDVTGRRIRVSGLVQGVGFRPHVWRLARDLTLTGMVRNDGEGVEIDAWGPEEGLSRFVEALQEAPPPLARVDAVSWVDLDGPPQEGSFEIVASRGGMITTGVVPDAATCPECLSDMRDPANRRFGYAFAICTHCGPRLSILHAIPYDRGNTSMSRFPVCDACSSEYEDPVDRRFHAQPIACPDCGPRLWLEDRGGCVETSDPVAEAARRIALGHIVAVKGIGGFHLACDALNEKAVAELRRRKRRRSKPLALMAADLTSIRRYCRVTAREERELTSIAAPIVLLEADGEQLAPSIAPGQDRVGFLLPYTPLHHLLLRQVAGPLVLTSGNLSEEPQAITNEDARGRLAEFADCLLMHNREIVNRLDDSVVSVFDAGPQILRRARGYAPAPLSLPDTFARMPPVLAMGGELKSAFCMLSDGRAILSQHLGDLEEAATHGEYRRTLDLYQRIFRFDPAVIAVDAHPDYLSTQWGKTLASDTGCRIVQVQHHHAHLAACLADNSVPAGEETSLGLVLDGLGLGSDGTIWGGEILLGGYRGFERVGHFQPVPLPGGAQAVRQPWRNLAAHLRAAFGSDYLRAVPDGPLRERMLSKQLPVLDRMMERGLNAPLSSSAGRLFDAVAAALGIAFDRQDHEGEAAMMLECLARPFVGTETPYPVERARREASVLTWKPLFEALLSDLARDFAPGRIAARFHLGLVAALTESLAELASAHGVSRVVLSGGVMQNRILHDCLAQSLLSAGLEPLSHRQVPANDGGLALGQAVIAASRVD
ncbi:carbamoyltransferase HypF [Rhodobacterales bacterium]|nr:carbamoyltransferase HypF [Rhodobacterales bacterium]